MTENEITMLMLQIADMGITGLKIRYEGSGDDGAVDWIGYTKEPCETPEDVDNNLDVWDNEVSLLTLNSGTYSLIQEFVNFKLLETIENWWDDDGGFGEVCICIPSGKYIINNHIRITETEDYYHEGSLLNMRSDV